MDTTLPSPAAAEVSQRRLQIMEEILKELMSVKTNDHRRDQLADASNEDLLTELLSRFLNERVAGRAAESPGDAASDQQLKDAVAAAVLKEKNSAAKSKRKKRRKQKQDGGLMSIMMVACGSIMMLIFSLSLIHQIGGSGQGGAPPAMRPSASRSLRDKKHQSNNVESVPASPEVIIISPLPASIVAPPPIFSPAAASNHHTPMKFNKLRSEICLDTPNWEDKDGDGCDSYKKLDRICSFADGWAGDMGPATEHCCLCGGGSISLPPTNSPTISDSPTKSATPSTSPTITISPSISSSPTEFCLDTPNWTDKGGQGCDHYKKWDRRCSRADFWAGVMGPATEHCCVCGGGSVSLPPTNSPNPSSSPTTSVNPSTFPSSSPSILPSTSSSPTEFCVDTPNWKSRYGSGCDEYEEYDRCGEADDWAGDMGTATEHCCVCQGGIRSVSQIYSLV